MQATGEILDIWNICNLTINQTGVSSIYTNINLHSLPNNDKLSDILNECCKTNENLYKKRKLLNAKKVKLARRKKQMTWVLTMDKDLILLELQTNQNIAKII